MIWQFTGAEGIDTDGCRLGDANRVGDLDFAAISKPRSDNILRDVAAGVRSASVNF